VNSFSETVDEGAAVRDSILARGVRVWPGVWLEPASIRFSSDV